MKKFVSAGFAAVALLCMGALFMTNDAMWLFHAMSATFLCTAASLQIEA